MSKEVKKVKVCPLCKGTGIDSTTGETSCPKCNGTGRV